MKKFLAGALALAAIATMHSLPARGQVAGAISVVAGSGNVAAATATATLPATQNRTTYLCGYIISGLGATAGSAATLTITGLASGTITSNVGVPAGATVPVNVVVTLAPSCQPASGPNTSIALAVGSFGTGNTNASIVAWGYQGQ